MTRQRSSAVFRLDTAASGCGCGNRGNDPTAYLAQAFVPDVMVGACLEISDGDEIVWRRDAPAEPPRVDKAVVKVDRRGNATVSWDSSGDLVEFWLRWSRDGETWQSVTTGLRESKTRISAGQLPPGDGLLQVVAHDGFSSSYAEPVPVTIPDHGAEGVILHPVQGHTYVAGQSVRLWASVVDVTGDADGAGDDAVWLVDGSEVGRGVDAWATLDPGEHTVTFRPGKRGGATSVTVTATR